VPRVHGTARVGYACACRCSAHASRRATPRCPPSRLRVAPRRRRGCAAHTLTLCACAALYRSPAQPIPCPMVGWCAVHAGRKGRALQPVPLVGQCCRVRSRQGPWYSRQAQRAAVLACYAPSPARKRAGLGPGGRRPLTQGGGSRGHGWPARASMRALGKCFRTCRNPLPPAANITSAVISRPFAPLVRASMRALGGAPPKNGGNTRVTAAWAMAAPR